MRWRSFLALTTLALVGCGVALEFAARKAAVDISQSLEPHASLTYSGAGIALDGSVRLQSPRLEIHRGIWQGKVEARVAEIRGSSAFWIVWRSLSGNSRAPDSLSVSARGLHLIAPGAQGPVLEGWLGSSDLVVFENLGCGSDALGDKDRSRMGVDTRERVDEFHFQYDPAKKLLNASFELESEGIATINAHAELSGLDLERLGDPTALATARLTRADLSYEDSGYFSRRNHFCAQWLGSSSGEFVTRHVSAVADFLSARGIVPGKELLALYEKLVSQGGTLSLTSLPDASWIPAEVAAYPREALLRQLNITARLTDAPPIMLRLAFADPEAPIIVAGVPSGASATQLDVGAAGESPAVAIVESAKDSASETPIATAPEAALGSPVDRAAEVVEPAASSAEDANPVVAPSIVVQPGQSDSRSDRRVIASAPPPPKDSTLALVWKPGEIERLPQAPARHRRYRVVPLSQLATLVAGDVQLLTSNGKRIDGQLKQVLGDHVVLQVQVVQGSAELNVPLVKIREVRVFERAQQPP